MTPNQITEARQMRADGKSWCHIAKHFGVAQDTVRRRLDPTWAEQRRDQVNVARRIRRGEVVKARHKHVPEMRVSDKHDGERLLREVPLDTRGFTARILGDPLPGRSALDRKREAVHV